MNFDKRYRQAGYRDTAGGKAERADRGGPRAPEGPRSPGVLGSRTVSRCGECGARLLTLTDAVDRCPACGVELRACRQCAHFDPGRRFECTEPIPARIPDKSARNDCACFSLRVSVERDTASGSVRPEDARRAFDGLFKRGR